MESFESQSLIMGQRLRELRTARHLSFESLKKALMEKYNISISIDSLKNYEVSQSWHTKAAQKEGMSIKYLRCFADFYGVSADYLLGMDVPQTPDVTIREMIEKTGLSERAIGQFRFIKDVYPYLMPITNAIFEETMFPPFIYEIGRYLGCSNADLIIRTLSDHVIPHNYESLDKNTKKHLLQELSAEILSAAKNRHLDRFTVTALFSHASQSLQNNPQMLDNAEEYKDFLSIFFESDPIDICELRTKKALTALLENMTERNPLISDSPPSEINISL